MDNNHRTNRIIGYDVARALAVFGMVLVNFKIVMGAAENGPDWLVGFAGLFDGRAAALFVVLAGVGISLLSQRGRLAQDQNRISQDRRTLFKRAVFLFVVGLVYTPIWPADILHFYGVYLVIAALLMTTSNRRLWLAALGAGFGFVLFAFFLDYETGWNFATLTYTDFWTLPGMGRHILFNGFHPVFPWVSFLLIGMWLGRQDMGDPSVRQSLFFRALLTAILAEAASFLFLRWFPGEIGSLLFGTDPLPPGPLYVAAGAGTAIIIIMLCLEVTLRTPQAGIFRPLVATGQLALTTYVAHVVVGMGFLELVGRLENQPLWFALLSAGIFSGVAVLFSHFWKKRSPRGPLEGMMRRVTG